MCGECKNPTLLWKLPSPSPCHSLRSFCISVGLGGLSCLLPAGCWHAEGISYEGPDPAREVAEFSAEGRWGLGWGCNLWKNPGVRTSRKANMVCGQLGKAWALQRLNARLEPAQCSCSGFSFFLLGVITCPAPLREVPEIMTFNSWLWLVSL